MQEEKNAAAAIISLNSKLAFCPIIWFPEDIYCEQNFKQEERTYEDPGVCTCTSNWNGKVPSHTWQRDTATCQSLHDLDMWVLPSVFKVESILYKSTEHFKSPSSANSKRNPGNKQMNKNILHFHMKHLDQVDWIRLKSILLRKETEIITVHDSTSSGVKTKIYIIFFHQC